MPDLTVQQERVLEFIAAYYAVHDQAPTSREIAEELGVSPQAADGHISELVLKGHLSPRLARHRHIVLTAVGREAAKEIERDRQESSLTGVGFRPIAEFGVDSRCRLRT